MGLVEPLKRAVQDEVRKIGLEFGAAVRHTASPSRSRAGHRRARTGRSEEYCDLLRRAGR